MARTLIWLIFLIIHHFTWDSDTWGGSCQQQLWRQRVRPFYMQLKRSQHVTRNLTVNGNPTCRLVNSLKSGDINRFHFRQKEYAPIRVINEPRFTFLLGNKQHLKLSWYSFPNYWLVKANLKLKEMIEALNRLYSIR